MIDLTPLNDIKQQLYRSLESLKEIGNCALLDCPPSKNFGSNLLWISAAFYLTDVLKVRIKYASSIANFSTADLETRIGKAPIILRGGLLGDYWGQESDSRRDFYARIVDCYQDRPIYILPISFYFSDQHNLQTLAKTFDRHPQLTIFTRESYSDRLAKEHFPRANIILSPDMVFHLVDLPCSLPQMKSDPAPLYLKRIDYQYDQAFLPVRLNIPGLKIEDWVPYHWLVANGQKRYLPGLSRLIREFWQRGVATPKEWLSRQKWKRTNPLYTRLAEINRLAGQRPPWPDGIIHSCFYQLQQHHLIITDRIHGHIVASLLGIPNILLPGPIADIMGALYDTWTCRVPYCRYVTEPNKVRAVADELLALYPSSTALAV